MKLSELLNPEQLKAVNHPGGPMMIIAGAGSGKTRVLTYRIAKLMLDGVDPFRILALTFTNKAAREMKERIAQVVGESEARNIWMGTFHSVFARILRREAERLGYPSHFSIYDQEDSEKTVRKVIKELKLDPEIYKPKQMASRISLLKNNLITPKVYRNSFELMEQDVLAKRPDFLKIYMRYNDELFRSAAMDFDDLLLKTNELLAKHPDVLLKYQQQFEHILVDEYQDTNHSQYLIVRALGDLHRNIAVVGDDSQSIYSFRGANIQNILNFKKDYPDAAVYKLEQNYRSTKNIVGAGNSLIKNNRLRLEKTLWTSNEEGEKIKVVALGTDTEEARWIADDVAEQRLRNGLSYNDFAILYRTNSQSRALESALRSYGIPYRIYGGLSFYQRKEIKDVLAYLRLIVNERDEEALRRIINFPSRKIGRTTMEKLTVLAGQYNKSIFEIIEEAENYPASGLTAGTIRKLKDFATQIRSFQVLAGRLNVYELTKEVIKSVRLLEAYRKEGDLEGQTRVENVEELINAMAEFISEQNELADGDAGLPAFLQQVALITTLDQENDDEPKLTLMTVHMSKGLEFPYVYVSGMEENLFPSGLSVTNREDLEEERRLLYVAITRAKKRCVLTYARMRYRWGSLNETEPSRFLDEIDEHYLERSDLSGKKSGLLNADIFDDKPVYRPAAQTPSNRPRGGVSKTIRPKNLRPLSKASRKETKGNEIILNPGDRVYHSRFGKGTVIALIDMGTGDAKAKIKFDHTGEKTLLLRFAKLEKL
jgi:DNA helicase-2/ATP-dependent DNA helicase PcrA